MLFIFRIQYRLKLFEKLIRQNFPLVVRQQRAKRRLRRDSLIFITSELRRVAIALRQFNVTRSLIPRATSIIGYDRTYGSLNPSNPA